MARIGKVEGVEGIDFFSVAIEDVEALIVPAICLFEVYSWALRHGGRDEAIAAVAGMRQGVVVPLSERLAMNAADLSVRHRLPALDSLILATARDHDAVLWTQDAHFDSLDGVRFRPKV